MLCRISLFKNPSISSEMIYHGLPLYLSLVVQSPTHSILLPFPASLKWGFLALQSDPVGDGAT